MGKTRHFQTFISGLELVIKNKFEGLKKLDKD